MTRKKFLTLVLFTGVLAAGYVGMNYAMGQAATRLLASLEANMPTGYKLSYREIKTSLLQPEIEIHDLKVTSPTGQPFAAEMMCLVGWPGFGGTIASLWSINVMNISWDHGVKATASSLRIDRPGVDVVSQLLLGASDLTQSKVSFASGELSKLKVTAGAVDATAELLFFGATTENKMKFLALTNVAVVHNNNQSAYRDAKAELVRIEDVPLTSFAALLNPDPAFWAAQPVQGIYLRNAALTAVAEPNPEPVTFTAAELAMGNIQRYNGIPIGAEVNVKELKFPPTGADDPGAVVNMNLAAHIDPTKKNLLVDQLMLDSPNKGKLNMKMELQGAPWPPQLLTNAMGWIGTSLASFEIVYDDAGYVPSVIEQAAKAKAKTAEQVRAEMRSMWDQSEFAKGPKMAPLGKVVLDFLDKPGRLTVVSRPEKPLLLMEVAMGGQNPEALAAALNLFITAQ